MPRLHSEDVKVYNPATGTKQTLEAFSMPQLLPDIQQITDAAGGSPSVMQAAEVDWSVRISRNWQIGAQLTLGSLVTTVGIPLQGVFEDVLKAIGIDAQKVFNEALREAGKTLQETIVSLGNKSENELNRALESSLSAGVGHAVDNVSVIPVIGWVVDILVGLGKLIAKIVKIHRRDQLDTPVSSTWPSKFNAEADTLVFERLYFERIRSFQDWTPIYMPPTLGKVQSHHGVFVEELLEPGCTNDTSKKWQACAGIRFIGGNPIEGAAGNVPGAGWLHQSIEYFRGNINVDPGDFLPTTRSQAGWLWQSAIKGNTPTAFTIDCDQLQAMWEAYLYDLRTALWQSARLNNEDRKRILRFWDGGYDNKGDYRKIFGWYSARGPVPQQIQPANNEWDHYAPVKEVKDLRKKQRQMLDTILVAYLSNDFPAVNNAASPEFHDLWERRRRQLLEHPDRCFVDLSNVPDGDYRRALRESGVGAGICSQLGGGFKSPGAPDLRPSRTTPGLGQDGMPGGGNDGSTPAGTKQTSSGGALAIGAALVVVGYAAHKGYFEKIF